MRLSVSSLACLTACSGKVEMVQVPVVGLPCAATGQALQHMLVMEAKHATGTTQLTYGGAGTSPRPPTIDLAKGTDHPLTIRFTDLRERVVALEGFTDDPHTSNEPKLEAIQMAWYEEWKDGRAEG